ncbi:hypothetical protein ACH47Z_15105 [Streptomyces sp. NPDC020192]|uniref:hypothetical protein n=1 Tax=Streptomyces sp. NPDC020192 TaxID=3365066 RepID=UPI0037A25233
MTRNPTERPFFTRSSTSRAFSAASAASFLVFGSLPLWSRKYVWASSMISTTNGQSSDGPTSHMDFTPSTLRTHADRARRSSTRFWNSLLACSKSSPTKANMRCTQSA